MYTHFTLYIMYGKSITLRIFLQLLSIRYQQQNFSILIHFKTLAINSLLCKVYICVDLPHIYVDLRYCDIAGKILTN